MCRLVFPDVRTGSGFENELFLLQRGWGDFGIPVVGNQQQDNHLEEGCWIKHRRRRRAPFLLGFNYVACPKVWYRLSIPL